MIKVDKILHVLAVNKKKMDQYDFTFWVNSRFDPFAEDCNLDAEDAAEGEGAKAIMNIPMINENMNESMWRKKCNVSAKTKDFLNKKYSLMSTSSTSKMSLSQQISGLLRAWASVKTKKKSFDFRHDIWRNYLLNNKKVNEFLKESI